ncbi:thiol reductant ABC exporter subunit CydC [Desulforamulus hydrothermalis]|uniref:Putative fused ATPase and permease component of metabolite transporter n=1 Tax=Desulforamulus hydrothermalis Lam5 = DSM 18033 TaxID=1121428 RepID=K8E6Z8_9FIRM|nr:thiol reductant ABC exporter subunit CydC [Desulforamulus hydrothermalis]CCO07253.1 putative fused ATPase and permease component of metabolite transporter [Desulforamulus hydrothermalis Lam5 = DSM 18033]SHG92356.1 ATP-binding cassette, subfamily C, CydC [Desulforamulus hydrothermalis Lam5 = DSM 18033]
MKILNFLLRLLLPYQQTVILAGLLGVCTIGSNIGLMAVSAYLIAWAALQPPVLHLVGLAAAVRFFGLARAVSRYLERYLSHQVILQILSGLRVWFYQKLEPLAPACLLDERSGDLLSRLVQDVETLKYFYLKAVGPLLTAFLIMVPLVGWLAGFNVKFAYIIIFFFLLSGIVLPPVITALGRRARIQRAEVRARLYAQLTDSLQGLTEIIAFDLVPQRLNLIKQTSRELLGWQKQLMDLGALGNSLNGLVMHLAMWAVLVTAVAMVEAGLLPGIYLAVLALVVLSSWEAVTPLSFISSYWEESREAVRRLLKICEAEPAVQDPAVAETTPDNFNLQVTGLRFRYHNEGPWVLDNLHLHLPQGGRVAVVGPSGAGKSTLVNLLLRFWDYHQGEILLGGKSIKTYCQDDVLKLIAVVPQRTHLFNATIRENIWLARPQADEEEIIMAAKRAGIHSFIESLPQGYETYIGEGGFKLSGGQRQRLAIARALLKNAPILLLDEATAGLDPITEKEVLADIYKLMQGRTTLVITHRLTGLQDMDEILVLHRGQVVERGRHDYLLRKRGLYWAMWQQSHDRLY